MLKLLTMSILRYYFTERVEPVRNFKYQRAERVGGRIYYYKICLHCNGKYESRRMDSAFCRNGCAKASRRKRKIQI